MIRRFRDSDMEDVINIWLDASIEAHDFIDRHFWKSKAGDMKDVYLPACKTYVHEDEQGIRGFLSLRDNTLAALFVSPECQGRGIGRQLVERAKDLRDHLELSVYKDNHRSVRFYEKCGFQPVSERLDEHTGCPESVMRFCG